MRTLITLFISLMFIGAATAKPLQFGSAEYAQGCIKREWLRIQEQLKAVAGERSPTDLMRLVRAYVCGQGEGTMKQLLQSSSKLVLSSSTGSGQEDVKELVANTVAISPQAGQAWGVEVHDDYPKITVSFFVNEACGRSVTLKPSKSGWLIVGVGEGCD